MWLGKAMLNPHFKAIQKFMCLYGQAGSGKSTTVSIVESLIGYRAVLALQSANFTNFDSGNLPGKRLIIFSETGEDSDADKFSAAAATFIKQASGGDMLRSERKNQQPINLKITPDILLVGNTPPVIPMHTEAFRRRAVFLKWDNVITTKDGKIVEQMLNSELPGIMLWALKGAAMLEAGGESLLVTPQTCMDDLLECSEAVDIEREFVRTQLKKSEKDKKFMQVSKIMDHFEKWAAIKKLDNRQLNSRKIGHIIRSELRVQSVVSYTDGATMRGYEGVEFTDPTLKKTRELHPGRSPY
jgi:phage/plasmid-associated DNA primase